MPASQYLAHFTPVHLYQCKAREMPIYCKGLKYNIPGRCKVEKMGTDAPTWFHICKQSHSGINPRARFFIITQQPYHYLSIVYYMTPKARYLDDETVSIINGFNIIYGLWPRRRKSYNFIPLLNVQAL